MSPMTATHIDRLRCPYCRTRRNRNVESRQLISRPEIRRRKECLGCHRRYTTRERIGRTLGATA